MGLKKLRNLKGPCIS